MKKQRRNHSQEFKREAVALVVEHGYSCAAAGRSIGVSGALIGRWKRDLEDNGAATSAALRAHVRLNEYPLPEG